MNELKLPEVREPEKGYRREWLKCKKCETLQYNDYIPYSLANPTLISVCGHDIKKDMETVKVIEPRY